MKTVYIGLFLFAFFATAQSLDCLNGNNVPVAWWAKLKLPQSLQKTAHLYYDSEDDRSASTSFRLQPVNVDDASSAMSQTLDQLNRIPRSSVKILAFNDEFPDGRTRSDRAHAKGVLAFDPHSNTGFYIMHSTPKFPAIDDNKVDTRLPGTGIIYAQNYMCITIDALGLDSILTGFAVSRLNVYYDNANLKPKDSSDNTSVKIFNIRMNGQKIHHLSISPQYIESLYTSVIAPFFQTNLAVESWSHPIEPPQCNGQYTCINIHLVKYNEQIFWFIGQDHSKWAISFDDQHQVVCFGDLNRAKTQNKRGGGALCFDGNSHLYQTLRQMLTCEDKCVHGFLSSHD